MVAILMMSTKLATLGFLKTKVFWNKCYDVIIFVHYITNKISLSDSNYILDVVIWPRFGNSSISMRKVIITSTLQGFDRKNHFFEGRSWFKLNNFGLKPGMASKFYTSVAKGLKVKVKKLFRLIPPSWIGLIIWKRL